MMIMIDFKNPFNDPNLTYKGKTARERGEELEKERRKRDLEARIAEKRRPAEPDLGSVEPEQPEQPSVGSVPPLTPTQGFKIEEFNDRYRIHNVEYNGALHVVDMSKELLDNGNNHTQEEWVDLTKDADWKLADSQLYNAVIMTLYNNQNPVDSGQKDLIEKTRQVLKKDFTGSHYMMTSSRVKYAGKKTGLLSRKKQKSDTVTHDWKCSTARKIKEDIVGEDDYVNASCGFEDSIDALLGTRDLAQVENAYEWVSGQKPYLYRFNSKPDADNERAVVLGVDGSYNWFYIVVAGGYDGPARGWSTQRARKTL